jgi:hypothetical protein
MKKKTPDQIIDDLENPVIVYDEARNSTYIEDNKTFPESTVYRDLNDLETEMYIQSLCYLFYGFLIPSSIMKELIRLLDFMGRNSGDSAVVANRVMQIENTIYINTGAGKVIKISKNGVKFIKKSKAKFAYSKSIGKLVKPDMNSPRTDLLRKYILVNDAEYKLILVFIFNCFLTNSHYVMLLLMGPPGSGKSFITKVLQAIIDPGTKSLRNSPSKTEDFVIAALHSHLCSFNNVSKVSASAQDILCTTLTGGTYATRAKFSNKSEVSIYTHNPVIINSIGQVIDRDDALERSILVQLQKIQNSEEDNKQESKLEKQFMNDLPFITAGIFNDLSKILKVLENFNPAQELQRMADFHVLGLATEDALEWPEGSFNNAYIGNLRNSYRSLIENSDVAKGIIKIVKNSDGDYKSTYLNLLTRLDAIVDIRGMKPRDLGTELDRLSSALFSIHGISVRRIQRSNKGHQISISAN